MAIYYCKVFSLIVFNLVLSINASDPTETTLPVGDAGSGGDGSRLTRYLGLGSLPSDHANPTGALGPIASLPSVTIPTAAYDALVRSDQDARTAARILQAERDEARMRSDRHLASLTAAHALGVDLQRRLDDAQREVARVRGLLGEPER